MSFCRYSSVDSNSSALRIQGREMDFSWNSSYVLAGGNTTVFTYYSQFGEKNHFVDGSEVAVLVGIFLLSVVANSSIIFCVIRLVLLFSNPRKLYTLSKALSPGIFDVVYNRSSHRKSCQSQTSIFGDEVRKTIRLLMDCEYITLLLL